MRETWKDWRGLSDVEICRKMGFDKGTKLIGDEGYGPSVIQITAIGEEHIMARVISHNGNPVHDSEGMWTLSCRKWARL